MPREVTMEQSVVMLERVIQRHEKETLPLISQEWAKDSTEFVYKDRGDLQDSVQLHSDFKKGIARWRTPYARIRYYLGGVAGDGNRKGVPRWAEVAKKKNKRKYQLMAAKLMRQIKKEVFR